MKKWKINLLLITSALFLATAPGCVSVKEYQKMYVNDRDMEVADPAVQQFENNMAVFREGAAGANGGKSGGGCACN